MATNTNEKLIWDTAEVDPTCDFTGVDCVFGYGSLVWKPPCDPSLIESSHVAALHGWTRRFWQESLDHRGTPESPGRVVTILRDDHPDVNRQEGDEESVTVGTVFKMKNIEDMLVELDFRERNGYTRTLAHYHSVNGGPSGKAIVYYAKPGNDPSYIGKQSIEDVAKVIATSVGPSGPNRDYLFNLETWCTANNVDDDHILPLATMVRECLNSDTRNATKTLANDITKGK
eukprot:m.107498 g.107498  ORF g.107498 m.107498 type:complete len:230 (-) comp27800_c3_seq2:96-785(-)